MPAAKEAVKPVTPVEVTVWPLWVPPLPPVYGMLLPTPLAAVPEVSVPVVVAEAQLRAVRVAAGKLTVLLNVQLCPPKLIAKLAVPAALGVPVMEYVKLPAPVARVPAVRVAVKPVTPVEVTVWLLKVPPLPPV